MAQSDQCAGVRAVTQRVVQGGFGGGAQRNGTNADGRAAGVGESDVPHVPCAESEGDGDGRGLTR